MKARAIIERDTRDYYSDFVADMTLALAFAAEAVRLYLTTMPPHRPKHLAGPLPGGFYSGKQQRYVMWALGEGHIVVPYNRTAELARSWKVEWTEVGGDTLAVQVYQDPSLASYGKYVQDPRVRAPMHEDWPDPDKAKQELEAKVVGKLEAVGRQYGFK